jgi:membrane glycosyltransferase
MTTSASAPVVAAGLVGGFATARYTGHRALGGVVLGAAGAWCSRRWLTSSGPGVTGVLLGTYLAAFAVSHPLAKKLGAWPSVLVVAAAASGVSYVLADRAGGEITAPGGGR